MTVTIYDPTYAGNTVPAFDSTGVLVGAADFAFSSTPGMNTPDTRTVVFSGIRRLDLAPAPGDYVAYDVSFVADTICPPVGDSLLDAPAVNHGLKDALRNSNPDATPGTGQKKEIGGYIWKALDGRYYTQEVADPTATECTYNIQPLPVAPESGSSAVGKFHTHPSAPGEAAYGCLGWAQTPDDGLPPAKADPDRPKSGGGSDDDWAATSDTYPVYVITKTNRVYKLDQQYANNRPKNPLKWELDSYPGCPTKLQ